ncbi:MAG: hypothetical protein LBS50_08975 [Prevotellaceae bacterium]|jgi:hypothetical protein|nr:hypothetical protein [Prevotellaceae bacterium]
MQKKTLIFNIGYHAGFYSEYLGMLFAIAYCRMNGIGFKLFSKDANFKIKNGWTDYFLPFCEEVTDDFHSTFNSRFPFPSVKQYAKFIYKKLRYGTKTPKWIWLKFTFSFLKQSFQKNFYKKKYNFTYYTFELWNKFYYQLNPCYNYSVLDKKVEKQTLRDLYKHIICETYKFNEYTENQIDNIIKNLNLPEKFVGIHIRQGDKITEDEVYDWQKYFTFLYKNVKYCKNVFIFTDDYQVIENIKAELPDYQIYTLCKKEDRGYDNNAFQNRGLEYKTQKLLEMFASVEILCKSALFIGAYNSSPDMFIDFVRENNSFFIDKNN